MDRRIIFVSIIILCYSCSFSQAGKKLEYKDFSVMVNSSKVNIHLTDKISNVNNILGKPDSIKKELLEKNSYITLRYKNLWISYFDDSSEIYTIMIMGDGLSTYRGLKTGATYEEIVKLYGQPTNIYNKGKNIELINYEIQNPKNDKRVSGKRIMQLNIEFDENNTVKSIYMNWES